MTITVHNISGSPMGWRVLLGLEIKRLDYKLNYLRGSEREQRQDAFLRKNPHGRVPVLEYEGIYRRESLAILGWLDQQFPQRPLFGETVRELRLVWATAVRFSDYLLQATNAVVFPVFNGTDGSPKIQDGGISTLDEATHLLNAELLALEETLQDQKFLCGSDPTGADAVAYPDIGRIMRAIQTKPNSMAVQGFASFDTDWPNIARWRDRVQALPGYARTVPPHWN